MTDYYKILGVDRRATDAEIKQAFRKLAMQHHPDRGGNQAEFQRIQEAYATLGDPQRRQQYDNPRPQFHGFESEFVNSHFDFDSIFNMFGARFQSNIKPQARIQVWLTLQDIVNNNKYIINVNTPQGQQAVEINIPPGVDDGDTVQYSGIAPGGMDLIVTFKIRPDARWVRRGSSLHTQCDVSFWELILGTVLPVESITGTKLEVTVPPMTAPDQLIRMRGQGLPDRNNNRGDLVIKLNPVMPRTISPELLNLIQKETGKI